MSEPLLKVEVTATNNYQSGTVSAASEWEPSANLPLKKYVAERSNFHTHDDPQVFVQVMDWVASQWQHDGMNAAARDAGSLDILKSVHNKGERYRCVEYGRVMADILSSMGYYSRSIGLQSTDVAYGGVGKGHVATEVWSNSLNKWLFFDPQFSVYAQYKGEPLNIYDIYLLKTQGKFKKIDFITTGQYAAANNINSKNAKLAYGKFLSNYLGFHTSSAHMYGNKQNVYLMMEATTPALTFQGTGSTKRSLFTKQVDMAYPKINQTIISIAALPNENQDVHTVMDEFNIQTQEEYLDHMWRFSARGELSMGFNSNMHNEVRYQIKIDEHPWVDLDSNEYNWQLAKGNNRLEARSVSGKGVPGPVTFIDVSYQ